MAVYFIRGLGVQIYRIHGKTDTGFKMGASLPLPVTVCIDAFCLIFLSVSACHSPQPVLTMVNFLAFFFVPFCSVTHLSLRISIYFVSVFGSPSVSILEP